MSTNLTRNDARPSPSLYSAFSVNGTGSKAEWARIWRSLEIKIQDVKDLNLASPPWVTESNGLVNRPAPPKRGMLRSISSGFGQSLKGLIDEEEVRQKQEDTLYWSISVDGQTMARTPKRRVDTTTWTEVVKLEDIDEWHKCTLRLYRRTRFSNQAPETVCLGYVRVDARDLDADQTYEKKLPLLAFLTSDVLGQVRLTIKSDQLNIKGLAAYDVITQAIHSGDAKRIYKVAENASAEGGAAALCRIALAKGLLEPLICALIDEEVQTPSATLFRSNTPLTRCLEYIMRIQAVDYVRDTIGDDMRTLCSDTSLESGPISGASDVSVAVSRIWDKIYMSRHEFPPNLRWVFSYLLKAVARHHPNNKPLQLHSVSAFIFLRLIGPCIMWPETFGIVDFHPREEVEQKLKAIAKSLINLGFLIEPKEGDRSPLDAHFSGDFHRDNVAAMMDYLAVCASCDSPLHTNEDKSHPDLQNALSTRQAALMPSHTDSEAVLHVARELLVDVAKDAAWLYRIRQQKSAAEARKDSAASNAPKMRTVSMTSSQSGQSVSIGSSPQSRTSTLPTTNEGEPNPPEPKRKSRRPGSSSSRPVLVGPPPIIGQRTSSINRQPVKMVSLGQPI
ncbi:hypothetical protein FFLO_06748 [Filobasidium floriforme]|uniref:Ras-GAP domain-containing protein n=1 Tax=Filobasidium floriforme TaxID=5210 RepID=A0A8K0JJX6_9TREE|nr:hypothetical protein FFLO_06748 [Filobasidium floriforme]